MTPYSPTFNPNPTIIYKGFTFKFYYRSDYKGKDYEWSVDLDGYWIKYFYSARKHLGLSFDPNEWGEDDFDKLLSHILPDKGKWSRVSEGYRGPLYRNINGNILQWEIIFDKNPFNVYINGYLCWTHLIEKIGLLDNLNEWDEDHLNMFFVHSLAYIPY